MTPPAATAAARRAVPAGRVSPAPRPARRVSGPARPVAVPRRQPARRAQAPAGARLLAWLRALPDHRLLDRLIGGRVWIVLIGGLLVGIVTMQLALLRLNAGIGVAVERGSTLEQRNAALRTTVSRLSDSARIVASATEMGYVTPPQGSPRFLTASAGDAGRALTTMRVPEQAPGAIVPAASAIAVADTTVTDSAAATTTPTTADATGTATTTTPVATAPATTTPAPTTTTPDPTSGTSATTPTGTTAPVTTAGGAAPAAVGPQG
jgi:hypothetical protein